MKIESVRLKNYKVFRDVHLKDIPPFLVVVGANGSAGAVSRGVEPRCGHRHNPD
jgi:predicted ATPase